MGNCFTAFLFGQIMMIQASGHCDCSQRIFTYLVLFLILAQLLEGLVLVASVSVAGAPVGVRTASLALLDHIVVAADMMAQLAVIIGWRACHVLRLHAGLRASQTELGEDFGQHCTAFLILARLVEGLLLVSGWI